MIFTGWQCREIEMGRTYSRLGWLRTEIEMTDDKSVMGTWKEYFKKLMNGRNENQG